MKLKDLIFEIVKLIKDIKNGGMSMKTLINKLGVLETKMETLGSAKVMLAPPPSKTNYIY